MPHSVFRLFCSLVLLTLLSACGGPTNRVSGYSELIQIIGGGFPIDVQKREAKMAISLLVQRELDGPADLVVTFLGQGNSKEQQRIKLTPTGQKEFHLQSARIKSPKDGASFLVQIEVSDSSSGEQLYQGNQSLYLTIPPGVVLE